MSNNGWLIAILAAFALVFVYLMKASPQATTANLALANPVSQTVSNTAAYEQIGASALGSISSILGQSSSDDTDDSDY